MNQQEYERGYIITYRRITGSLIDPIVPICPIAPIKSIADPRTDYEARFEKGAEYAIDHAG